MTEASLAKRFRARVAWPQCVARARSTGHQCRAMAVIGTRCWLHGGAAINAGWGHPLPVWSLHVTPSGTRLSPSRKGHGRNQRERERFARQWPRPIRHWAAVELVARGRVERALFYRSEGKRLVEAVQARGVAVFVEHASRWVRRVRFEVAR